MLVRGIAYVDAQRRSSRAHKQGREATLLVRPVQLIVGRLKRYSVSESGP